LREDGSASMQSLQHRHFLTSTRHPPTLRRQGRGDNRAPGEKYFELEGVPVFAEMILPGGGTGHADGRKTGLTGNSLRVGTITDLLGIEVTVPAGGLGPGIKSWHRSQKLPCCCDISRQVPVRLCMIDLPVRGP